MTWIRLGRPQLVLLGWAVASVVLSLLPTGMGGTLRAVNAVAFLVLGPGCALMVRLRRSWSARVCSVVAIAVSLTALILSSQLLLLLGVWSAPGVAVLVALVTVALTVSPFRTRVEVRD